MSITEKKASADYPPSETREAYSDFDFDYKDSNHVQDVDRSEAGSSFLAYFNVVCVIAGTGTLGLPYALRLGGWIGLFILFLSWFMSTYTGIILIRCLYVKPPVRLSNYKEVATASFGWIGGWVTFFFNAWILLGAPILYMVLSGQNLNQLCKETAGDIGETPWIIISTAIVAIPFIIVKNMKEVAFMSAFGAAATLVTVLIVLIMACLDQKNWPDIHHDSVIWDKFPIALSTISFSFGGNAVYPHVEASMKKPKQWPWVAIAGLGTCAGMYFMTAVPGYYVYGNTVINPVYNSIPEGVPRIIAIVLMTVHVLMAAPILTTSFALDIEDMLNVTVERFGKFWEFIIRACIRIIIMVVVGVIACTVPRFDLLMSLIGSFANCALIFIFPVLFYWRLTGFRNKPIYELAWNALIIVLGIVGLIFGTIDSIEGLIEAFS
ncbi:transmembrane amino acid transporter protein-domain-containing protein [Zychaea mexicana]|uniref:transmembrane amino acid transporter protein-domain-containing protein n=1 Tax=Zychaea mexicana TaxID=64656 RepID=UPI0022FDF94B|nr:transmembrane amino acid transporter protein-domain-containing protein [Zychaea mexicana]KAI9495370.1 transmembrane amino acid transporter protein-domain-containing protein [Zychaea mexicana]